MTEVIKTVQEPVGVEKVIVREEQKPLSKDQVKELQATAGKANNYDPVAEEKRNNERMFEKFNAQQTLDPKIEAAIGARLVDAAEKEVAEAQAKLDAIKADNAKKVKEAEEAEKKAKEEADKAMADAKK